MFYFAALPYLSLYISLIWLIVILMSHCLLQFPFQMVQPPFLRMMSAKKLWSVPGQCLASVMWFVGCFFFPLWLLLDFCGREYGGWGWERVGLQVDPTWHWGGWWWWWGCGIPWVSLGPWGHCVGVTGVRSIGGVPNACTGKRQSATIWLCRPV